MCEIYGMSETDLDWEGSVEKKGSSIVELNGGKYEMTILEQDVTLASAIYKHGTHGGSLHNRSVTNSQISPMKVDGTVKVRVEMDFGDKDGHKFRASASAEVRDGKGNYGKVEAKRDSSGNGNVAVEAGHDVDEG